MDDKTLDYLGERVDKGREILRNIKDLKDKRNSLASLDLDRINYADGHGRAVQISLKTGLVDEIKKSTLSALDIEIENLRADFAEL